MEEQLTHQNEQGHGNEEEAQDGGGSVGDKLVNANGPAHEQNYADHVGAEKGEGDRESESHQPEHHREHQAAGCVPLHP